MLERLQQGFQRERQLTADVSHELRTPLGILKTQLSLARSRPRDADTLLGMMADMESDVDRMTRLTEQTLILTRVEQGGLVDLQPLDLGEMLESVVESWEAQAQACNVQLVFKRDGYIRLPIKGDADRLYQGFRPVSREKYTRILSTLHYLVRVLRGFDMLEVSFRKL